MPRPPFLTFPTIAATSSTLAMVVFPFPYGRISFFLSAARISWTVFFPPSFFMTFARCASTVLTLIPSTLAIILLEWAFQTKDTISRSLGVSGLIEARRFVWVARPRREVPGFRAMRRLTLFAVTAAVPAAPPIHQGNGSSAVQRAPDARRRDARRRVCANQRPRPS